MENNLTPQQRQAVEDRGGKLLVSAAAGSGKTKVLVDRLLSYVMDPDDPCNIDDFLIITYTKAAAAELRGKIAAKLSEHLAEQPENHHLQRQMQRLYLAKISTVHAFCGDLLREHAYAVDLPSDFRVADENECRQLREQAMTELLENAYAEGLEDPFFRAFIDTQGLGKDDRMVPEILFKVYDSARCHLDPKGWLAHCLKSMDLAQEQDAAQTVWGRYLMADLKEYLALQRSAMAQCAELAEQDPLMEKPAATLRTTLAGLDELAQAETWDQVAALRKIDYGRLVFSKKIADLELAERIKSVREGCKKGLESRLKIFCDPSRQVMEDLRQTGDAIHGLIDLTVEFGRRYEGLKRKKRVLDFSDLEHRTLDLLLGKDRRAVTKAAEEIGSRFREVLVDEYQDSNAVQDAIFGALTARRQNCFMVGDVKQSIYQFRLADPGIFLEKYASYAMAEDAVPGQGRKVMLSRNFRSGGSVLEATNDVFYRCMSTRVGGLDYTQQEALVEGVPHEPLGEPEVELHVIQTESDAYREEAEFVADRIRELLSAGHMVRGKDGLRPIEPEDIVILLRSPGSVGQVFQDALARRGIRSGFGGGVDLLQTGEIGVLRSLLQVISNPRQDIPLTAVLMSPVYAFSADDLARIRGGSKSGDLYDALTADQTEQSRAFLDDLAHFRWVARTATLAGLLEEIFCRTRMDSIYGAMESGVERTANLRDFFQTAVTFEGTNRRDLDQFLEYLDLMQAKGMTAPERATGGAVGIMSIHKSKGLEYPVVFLSALSRSFNREDLRANVLCDGELGLGLSAVDQQTRVRYPTIAKRAVAAKASGGSLSEELRVLYVAMTRAKDRLIMTYAAKTPEKELQAVAHRLDICGPRLLAGDVTCPGEWVLMEAMCRTEAGALFELAQGRPNQTHMAQHPWLIRVHRQEETSAGTASVEQEEKLGAPDRQTIARIGRFLAAEYPHKAAVTMPSKQTATQLKGRQKDQEAAENTPAPAFSGTWRSMGDPLQGGKAYGTAMHTLMQYLDFAKGQQLQGVEEEIARLIQRGLLTEEQARYIDRQAAAAFLQTDLGQRMIHGQVIREFKFSILEDASEYDPRLHDEKVLLQGVVDCALLEQEGITVVDFKTDRVTLEEEQILTRRYAGQVQLYARALERIYQQPVIHRYLYSFRLKKLIEV